jgi:serine/threonine protein phosphatase PrpC
MRNIFEGAHKRILAEYEKLTTLNFDGYTFSLTMTADRVDFYQSASCPYVLLQDFGTTAVVCVYWEESQKLLVANCGDSDALIGRFDAAAKTIQPNLLTISDNVSCMSAGEQERIKRDFGRKTKFGGGYLSPNDATYGFHSLAMTRALGHKFLEKYGVAWDPHIRQFQITPEDLVLVVGSDGLFDVVNSKAILSVAAERQPASYLPPSSSSPLIPNAAINARSPVPSISTPTLAGEGSSHPGHGNGMAHTSLSADSSSPIDVLARVLTPTESSEKLVQLALSNWKKQFNSSEVADNTTVCVLKLSDQFDSEVPVRSIDLHNSGTPFSPASVALHAFEAEIEETSKDHIIIDPTSSSTPSANTPAAPSSPSKDASHPTTTSPSPSPSLPSIVTSLVDDAPITQISSSSSSPSPSIPSLPPTHTTKDENDVSQPTADSETIPSLHLSLTSSTTPLPPSNNSGSTLIMVTGEPTTSTNLDGANSASTLVSDSAPPSSS